MSIFEGQIISFRAFDDIYEGIILEIRDKKIYTFDLYGNSKTITKEDIIDIDINIDELNINILKNYYKEYNCKEIAKHQLMSYKQELIRLQQVYKEKYAEYNDIELKIDNLKLDLIKSLDVYTHQEINEKFNNILKDKYFTIYTDDKYRLVEIRFNELVTIAKKGSFNIENLKFVNFFEDGSVYIEDESLWNEEAKLQVNHIYNESNKGLEEKATSLKHTQIKVLDRIILGGAIEDLTVEKELIFVPKTLSSDKKYIDTILHEVANFIKNIY